MQEIKIIFLKFHLKLNSSDTGVYKVVRPGNVSPTRFVPHSIAKPPYYYEDDVPDLFQSQKNEIKMPKAIEAMRDSCRLAANILDKCEAILKVTILVSNIK